MGHRFFVFALLCFLQCPVFAEIPGTARSNERDVMRFDLGLGLSSPAPGITSSAAALLTFKPVHAVGFALNLSHHNQSSKYSKINTQAYDLIWEYSVALFEGFHALRIRGGLGVANSYLAKRTSSLNLAENSDTGHVWLGHALASVSIDFPQADLMWLRCGLWAQHSFSKEFPVQAGVFLGWVIGGQWVGIGD